MVSSEERSFAVDFSKVFVGFILFFIFVNILVYLQRMCEILSKKLIHFYSIS